MLETIRALDTRALLAINGAHCGFLDFTMFWASDKLVWIPFYVFLIYNLVMHYRKHGWILAAMAVLLVVISDQTSVQLFKEVVERLRPCHDPALEGIIRVPGGRCGGKYSFVSSHATNHFAIALFTGYFLQKKVRGFLPAMLLWAAVISYSRVYLGAHYPGDVIAGAAWGSLLALGMIIWGSNTLKSSSQPAATERHK